MIIAKFANYRYALQADQEKLKGTAYETASLAK